MFLISIYDFIVLNILNLTECTIGNDADEYKLPYNDVVPHSPTFEKMQEIVCKRKIRPSISIRWKNNSVTIIY